MPGTRIALQADQYLHSRTAWQVQVEEYEVWLGLSDPLFFSRWHKVVQGCLSITQKDDGIGEVGPLQIALDQARVARIVFYYQ
jgi:hypothetical protein